MVTKLFTEHPASVGETYAEHLFSALSFASYLLTAFFAVIVHALLPFLFKKTASNIIERLYNRMVTQRTSYKNFKQKVKQKA